MATLHFVLQGKGGVGKSMCAFFLVQFLRRHGREVAAFDADPVNATLSAFAEAAGYPVERVNLLDDTGGLEPRHYDVLIDTLARLPKNTHAVVDNGSSSFLTVMRYLRESDVFGLLRDNGHTVYVHTVVTGGQAVQDTLHGFKSLRYAFPDTPVIVWRNPFFGEPPLVELSPGFQIDLFLPGGKRSMWFRDVEIMLAEKLSFEDAMRQAESLMVRERLKAFWNGLCESIKETGILREDVPPGEDDAPTDGIGEEYARGEENPNGGEQHEGCNG